MESLPNDCLLKFNANTLQDVRKLYGFKNSTDMTVAIDVFEEWVKKQKHFTVKNFERSYLERIIIRCKGSLERAKERLDKMCTIRTLSPHFFEDFDIMNDFAGIDPFISQTVIPKMASDHSRVYIMRNTGRKFDSNMVLHYFQQAFLTVEYIGRFDYVSSYSAIIDYRETNLTDLAVKLNLADLQIGMYYLTEGFGARIKSIHIISHSKLVEMVVSLFKQIMSAKIGNRIYIHKSLDSLYDHVERDLLPIEYGGKEESFDKMVDEWRRELKQNRDYIKGIYSARTDESQRLTDKFNDTYMSMPGSFRTLSVD